MPVNSRKQQILDMLVDTPSDPFLLYALAMEYVGEGQDAEAVERFRELTQAAPDYVPGYHQQGLVLTRLGRGQEARNVLRRGIEAAGLQGNAHAVEEMSALLTSVIDGHLESS